MKLPSTVSCDKFMQQHEMLDSDTLGLQVFEVALQVIRQDASSSRNMISYQLKAHVSLLFQLMNVQTTRWMIWN